MKHQYLAQGLYIAETGGQFLLQQETEGGMETVDVLPDRETADAVLAHAARVALSFNELGITGARE